MFSMLRDPGPQAPRPHIIAYYGAALTRPRPERNLDPEGRPGQAPCLPSLSSVALSCSVPPVGPFLPCSLPSTPNFDLTLLTLLTPASPTAHFPNFDFWPPFRIRPRLGLLSLSDPRASQLGIRVLSGPSVRSVHCRLATLASPCHLSRCTRYTRTILRTMA